MGILTTWIKSLLQIVQTLIQIRDELRSIHMDFTAFAATITKLAQDVSDEVAAAVAAIKAAAAGDQSQLDAAVASLQVIDKAVTDAAGSFGPPAPPPVV